jgi:hypothetical protein
MDTHESHAPPTVPAAQSTGLVEFETAEVVSQMIYPPRPVLVVTGRKPHPSMTIELVPLVYIRQPEYWGIEVIGSGAGPRGAAGVSVPYAVQLDLAPCTGTAGVEVVGANQSKQLPVASEDATAVIGAVEGGKFRPLYPTGIGNRPLRLTTASVKDETGPEAYEIDLTPYEGSILRVLGNDENGWIHSASIAEQVRDSILSTVTRQVFADRVPRKDS